VGSYYFTDITQSTFASVIEDTIDSAISDSESSYNETSSKRTTYKTVSVTNGSDLTYAKYIEYSDGLNMEYVFGVNKDSGYMYYIVGIGACTESTMTSTMSSIVSTYKVSQ
jgi:hypothetical protein